MRARLFVKESPYLRQKFARSPKYIYYEFTKAPNFYSWDASRCLWNKYEIKKKRRDFDLRVVGIRRAGLIDVRGGWQALHDGSRGIPSWRGILRRRCRYSVMVTLAHFGQVPPMGIHILALLRFSLAYHPFHTHLMHFSFSLSWSFRFLLPLFFSLSFSLSFCPCNSLALSYLRIRKRDTHNNDIVLSASIYVRARREIVRLARRAILQLAARASPVNHGK